MSSVKIAVILPSRGLMFSQTAEEILKNLKNIPHKIYFSHRRPIPQCFEEPTAKALEDEEITHLWFIEDDMIVTPETLVELLSMDKAVVTADYPINRDKRGSVFEVGGQVIFCGTGCMLVKREVFDELNKPYFRTDMRWNIKNYGDYLKMTRNRSAKIEGYGLHDINFCMNLYEKNIPIHKIDTVLGQRKLVALGKHGSNDGAHIIETWTEVTPNHLLNQVKQWPINERGALTTVITDSGEINVSPNHAKKLIKEGLARRAPKRKLIIDWNEE